MQNFALILNGSNRFLLTQDKSWNNLATNDYQAGITSTDVEFFTLSVATSYFIFLLYFKKYQ